MTESKMDSRALPSQQPPQPANAGASAPKPKLNPTARSFVFSPAAAAWTPPAPVAAPPRAPTTPVKAAPTSTPTPTPSPATTTPTKSSVLKPSAKAFVPSFYAPAFVPSSYAAVAAAAPSTTAAKPSTEVATAVEAAVEPVVVAAQSKTEVTESSSSSSSNDAPAIAMTTETETTTTTETTTVTETTTAIETTTSTATATSATHVEPEAEEQAKPTAEPKTEQAATEQAATEAPTATVEEAETEQDAVIAARIMYTIAQLIEMEPESTPMPESIVSAQVAAVKGKEHEAPASAAAAAASSSSSSKRGGGGNGNNGGSTRSFNRSNSSSSGGGRGGGGRGGRGGGGRGGRGGRGGPPADLIPLADVVPLQVNEETRWKPSHTTNKQTTEVEEDIPSEERLRLETESALKEAKAILNKLSVEKFEKLSNQLIDVAVRSVGVLSGVIEMVIAKAQMEWHFSAMYAELCSKIAQTEMPAMALDEHEVAQDTHKLFRKLLLSRCQKEFEVTPPKDVAEWEALSEEDRAEKELLLKRATLGHIRFVGELYHQRMLSSRIMHECVQRLFGDLTAPDEESLECMCKLLTTIGDKLERSVKERGEMDLVNKYFTLIKQLSLDSAHLSTRVRFMLQDLLELRKNKYVARRKESKATTIAEVHAEAAREAKQKARASSSSSSSSSFGGSTRQLTRSQSMVSTGGSSGVDRRRGSSSSNNGGGASAAWKARAAAAGSVDADGWETVNAGARPKLGKGRSTQPGPSVGAAPRSVPLARNSSDGTVARNSFSMLSGGNRKDRAQSSSFSSAQQSRGRSSTDHASPIKPPRMARSMSSDLRVPPSSSSSPSKALPPKHTPRMSREVFEKKVRGIFDEFVGLRDLEEASACLTELQSPELHAHAVTQALNAGLEQGTKQREAAAALLLGYYERELVTADAMTVALTEVLEFAEDLEIDIPLTLAYVAEMVAPSVAAGGVPLPRLVAAVDHLRYNGKAAKLVALTLARVEEADKAQTLVKEASLDMRSLLAEGQREDDAALEALCKQHKLEWLLPRTA